MSSHLAGDPSVDGKGYRLRVACLSAHQASAQAIVTVIASVARSVDVEVTDPSATSSIPVADLFIIDATVDSSKAGETLLLLRAQGHGKPIIVISSPHSPLDADALRHVEDALLIPVALLAQRLPNAIADAMQLDHAAANSPPLGEVLSALRETQQLIAAGQIARRVRHDLSNPLAALLAEAQLLEMDPLPREQLEAVQRMVELCRRVVTVAKRLEGPTAG